ncbi:hypothetical protein GE061_018093 [Apolygus lucorum]|uniref:Histone-lysine N-methyltransferase eggless n=1 Tax=Apolygus lucorum TaxID=248454 RepID=A0A8S9XCX5_APOLU|nr:hypothetical protein GE061_018093 [Apolygus lucorum]
MYRTEIDNSLLLDPFCVPENDEEDELNSIKTSITNGIRNSSLSGLTRRLLDGEILPDAFSQNDTPIHDLITNERDETHRPLKSPRGSDLIPHSDIISKPRQKRRKNTGSQCSYLGAPESIRGVGGDPKVQHRKPAANKRVEKMMVFQREQVSDSLDFQGTEDSTGSELASLKRSRIKSRSNPEYSIQIYDLTTDGSVDSAQPSSSYVERQCSRSGVPESNGGGPISHNRACTAYERPKKKVSHHEQKTNAFMEGYDIAPLKKKPKRNIAIQCSHSSDPESIRGAGDTIPLNRASAAANENDEQEADSLDFQALKDSMEGLEIPPLKQNRDARVMNFENGGDMLESMYSHRNEFVVLEDENTSDDDSSCEDEYLNPGAEQLVRNAIEESILEFESVTNATINRSKEQILSNMENFVASGELLVNQIQQINFDMYKNFSDFKNQFKRKVNVLPELDIPTCEAESCIFEGGKDSRSSIRSVNRHSGKVIVKPPKAKDNVYSKRSHQEVEWVGFKVESVEMNCVDDNKIVETFTLVTTVDGAIVHKVVGCDEVAFFDPPHFQIGVGRRVIAAYKSSDDCRKRFLPGMVSESPSETNQLRYLVFFEVGHVQYCSRSDIRLVYKISKPVYEYFPGDQSTIVMEYLCNYPKTKKYVVEVGQRIRVEKNGFWVYCQVQRVDASLVLLKYLADFEPEWLYRGSPRLRPVFDSTKKINVQKNERHVNQSLQKQLSLSKIISSSIAYKKIDISNEATDVSNDDEDVSLTHKKTVSVPPIQRMRGSAKKNVNVLTILPPNTLIPRQFSAHQCSVACVVCVRYDPVKCKGVGLLAIPSIVGFERKVYANQVKYLSPCGVILSNIQHVLEYLSVTLIPLTLDMFTFSLKINIFAEWVGFPQYIVMDDVSFGVENIPIPCVNDIDSDVPCLMSYITERRPQDGVFIDQDPGFLISCDCEDNCANRSVCSCWKLNYESFSSLNVEGIPLTEIGYNYQRLEEPILSGIYECNRNCKCSATCINRVVQHPLKNKLQLFKTPKKGWGVRCLNDIPSGTFVCTYVAAVYTEEASNVIGVVGGDEYFAELDHIEIMEYEKVGYESDVDSDVPLSKGSSDTKKNKATSAKETYEPGTLRKLYGPNEYPYVLDAKKAGNIGRFFNHSCSPNMLVQNVFVDSHDLRYPWIAYFASQDIPAGSELTWNYGYRINSVPGKVLFCECDSPNCVIRLL